MSVEHNTYTMPLLFNHRPERQPIPLYKQCESVFYDAALGYLVTRGLVDLYISSERTANILFYTLPYACSRLLNAANSIFTSRPTNDPMDYDNMVSRMGAAILSIAGSMGLTYLTSDAPNRSATFFIGFFSSTALEYGLNKVFKAYIGEEEPSPEVIISNRML